MIVAREVPFVRRLVYAAIDPFFYLPADRLLAGTPEDGPQRPPAPSPSDLPAIAVVTPSYNQALFLERTIASVLSQEYPALQYVIQDGGSTDGSVAIIESHASQLLYWASHPDGGQSAAVNLAFRRTTAEIMLFLNADDVLLPGALHYIGAYFRAHPDVDVIYSHNLLIDADDRPMALQLLPGHDGRALRYYNYVPSATCAWRRRVWDAVGGALDESLHYAMDWDLFQRFEDVHARFVRVPTILAAFRRHGEQKTQQARVRVVEEGAAIMRRHTGHDVSWASMALGAAPHVCARIWRAGAYRMGIGRIELPLAAYRRDFAHA